MRNEYNEPKVLFDVFLYFFFLFDIQHFLKWKQMIYANTNGQHEQCSNLKERDREREKACLSSFYIVQESILFDHVHRIGCVC